MTHWEHYNPVRICAGQGQIRQLPRLVTEERWLLLTSAGFSRRGTVAQIRSLLQQTPLEIYDQITSNPELDELEALTLRFKNSGIHGIVALGGGSVIDSAKVLAVTLINGEYPTLKAALNSATSQKWQHSLPLIVIPTTSGTGAEVTPFATVWDKVSYKKFSVIGDKVFPSAALLDPNLTLSLPHEETLYTGLDAISHALESLWNINKTPISETFSWQALTLASSALPVVLKKPQDLVGREHMQQASLMAGLAISQTRTAIAHSISYPLTIQHGVPHGLACSFTLEKLIRLYMENIKLDVGKKSVLKKTLMVLEKLQLGRYLAQYVTMSELIKLKNEMFHKERSGNFFLHVDDDLISKMLLLQNNCHPPCP